MRTSLFGTKREAQNEASIHLQEPLSTEPYDLAEILEAEAQLEGWQGREENE